MKVLSVSLPEPVFAILSDEAGQKYLDPKDYAAQILENHVAPKLSEMDKQDILASRALVEQAIDVAMRRVERDGMTQSITFDSIQEVSGDPKWLDAYRAIVRDDPYKTGNPRKQTINQNLGYFIKKALGAQSVTKPDGRPMNVKVKGAIIQSYTPLKR